MHSLLRLAIVLGPGMGGPSESDERLFHVPVVEMFAAQFPDVDLSTYNAASTPGHHLVLALIQRIIDPDLEWMRFISGLPVSIMLGVLAWWCSRRTSSLIAMALLLPLACSPHTTAFGTLAIPESSSWLFVAILLVLACAPRLTYAGMALAGAFLLCSVGVRQITLWTAAPLVIAAWLSVGVTDHPNRVLPNTLWPVDALARRLHRAGVMLACSLPAILLLAWFIGMWGGMVPPPFQNEAAADAIEGAVVNEGLSPAAPAFILALFGIAACAFAPMVLRPALEQRRLVIRWALIGGAIGLVVGLVPATSYSMDAGRWGGIWNGAKLIPSVMDRSPLIAASSCLGGVMVGAMAFALPPARVRWILLSAIAGAMLAHVAGAQLFQRYLEPLVLILLAFCVATVYESREDRPDWWALLGPLALSAGLLALTIPRIGA